MLACCLLAASAVARGAPPILDLSAGFDYDGNVSRSELDRDIEEEFLLNVGASLTKRQRLGDRSGLIYRAGLRFEGHDRFGDLSNLGANGFLAYCFKPVRGYTAPWFSLEGSVTLLQHRDSDLRDGISSSLAALAGRRLTERWSARAGAVFEHRAAFDGEAFDNRRQRLFAALSFAPTDKTKLYGGYSVARGDFVSNARPSPAIIAAAKVIEPDPAFGLACGGAAGANGFCAYKIEATSHRFRLGLTYEVTRTLAVDLHARYLATAGTFDNDYESLLAGASLRLRFK